MTTEACSFFLQRKAKDGARISAQKKETGARKTLSLSSLQLLCVSIISTLVGVRFQNNLPVSFEQVLCGRVSVHCQVELVTPRQKQKDRHEGASRASKCRRWHLRPKKVAALEAERSGANMETDDW